MASRDQSKQRKLEILGKLSNHRSDITAKKQVLTEQITESKDVLTNQFKDKINVPKILGSKVKSSFSNSPNKWFLGSIVGGLVLSKLIFRGSKNRTPTKTSVVNTAVSSSIGSIFRSPKKREQTHGLFYSLMGYAARPMFKSFVIGKLQNYITNRALMQHAQRPREVYYEEYNQHPSHDPDQSQY